ncbi:heavy-metal-associated domain-containing protein [Mucilaginibacter segetis]|uniref:Heavy-metal-associated domain-containing protein n=1 Tax=Mucilaginibacter segetis TaxID=2793071 RepID=A0A934PS41_9SPHI|nr:heavy metal-associated domain-containing protein [Mucilaginibacter segetis]MBK0379774.1 heavy-metal-associated domain-containing protein [Mucilaginibacter segetis]
MKSLKIFTIILLAVVTSAKAQFTKAELQVGGLTCSMCAKATEKALSSLPFISEIKPDLSRNLYLITFKKDVPVKLDMISKKVKGAGFSVNYLKPTYNFANTKVANNTFSYAGDVFKIVSPADKALTGPVMLTLVDKGFAPASVSKKYEDKVTDAAETASGRTFHIAI